MVHLSSLDKIYRSILLSKYFIKGWGSPTDLKRLLKFRRIVSRREECFKLVPPDYPLKITKDTYSNGERIIEGSFRSPLELYLPGLLPEESKLAYFQFILPKTWKSEYYKPVCIHMAGTGDHYFWRRRHIMAKPLLKEGGIASILLENPFYGMRKPKYQIRSVLHNVSDIFVMGGCLILEALVLLHWCRRKGYGPLGVTGMSMGGHMASLAATNWPYPLVLVPCLSWSTASGVFTEGVISKAINWSLLETQYTENEVLRSDIASMVDYMEHDAFVAGRQFAKAFPTSITNIMNKRHQDSNDSKIANVQTVNRKNLIQSFSSRISSSKQDVPVPNQQLEVIHFMKGIMDECTHIANFSKPVDTSLIIIVCARDDGYVPREGVTNITDIWPGAEVRYLEAGHVSAFILHQKVFREAIIDAFERCRTKYPSYM
ncbi:protein ABHD18 [Cimex lectularius]|uniref:Protein ABHD18 n=1 Tax=Cimex lectularius TaxID=79782 RepID=A0A8I6S0I5_CIMLE|nr:protein ABHD18 [Cimex lectularius]